MIYIHPNGEKNIEEVPGHQKIAHRTFEYMDDNYVKIKYIARDGLTPPTKCIRTRFFRKHFDVPFEEIREVEDEMVKILKGIKD